MYTNGSLSIFPIMNIYNSSLCLTCSVYYGELVRDGKLVRVGLLCGSHIGMRSAAMLHLLLEAMAKSCSRTQYELCDLPMCFF